jgi:FtsP/CotA-like multicopper oxidase with cupredoxin domain
MGLAGLFIVEDERRVNEALGVELGETDLPLIIQDKNFEVGEELALKNLAFDPMHLRGFRFRVLERRNSSEQVAETAVDEQGGIATDLGWKDTVLEHEDAGMMVNYKVVGPQG